MGLGKNDPIPLDLSDLFCPFQKKWINDQSPLKIVEKGRQEGFTWIEAFWSVLRRLEVNTNHYFVSADEETAKNFIADCKFWLTRFKEVAGEEAADKDAGTVGTLIFPNGAKIVALSSNPKSIRGKRGDVTLDEFAFHSHAKQMYAASIACRRWGDGKQPGRLHIISTHNGPDSLFYKKALAAKQGKNPYSHHHADLYEAVADGLANKIPGDHRLLPPGKERNEALIEACRAECDDEETFEEEYLCNPASKSAMIRPEVYDICAKEVVPEYPDPSPVYPEGLFIGIDCGRSRDKTVCWVLQRMYDKWGVSWYRTVAVKQIRSQPFPVQHATLRPAWNHPELVKGYIDQGSQGRALADSISEETGSVIEPLGMGSQNKAIMAERARAFAQSKRVTLPAGDHEIKDDITSVRKIVSDKGNLTYEGGTESGHADAFWGLALALHAAEEDKRSVSIMVSRRPEAELLEGELVS